MNPRFTQYLQRLCLALLTLLTIPHLSSAQTPAHMMHVEKLCAVVANGSSSSCVTAPVITCPSIYYGCPGEATHPDHTGYATAVPGDGNCAEPIVTYTDEVISTGPCEGATEIHRTWNANYPNNDNPFLYAECTQLILLHDSDVPLITDCPTDINVVLDGDCEAVASWVAPTATDDCGLESMVSQYASGQSFPLGTTTVEYIATDLCGNTATCSFDVTVSGSCCTSPPVITCPEAYDGCPGGSIDPAVTGAATAVAGSTSCDAPTVAYTDEIVSEGPCAGSIEILRTWTASYPSTSDLSASCQQSIVLADTKAPLISNCPSDITVSPSDNCQAAVTWSAPVATDNCGVQTLESDVPNGSLFTSGNTVVTYTASDECGNTSTCAFTITVTSCCTEPPVITCPDDFTGCPGTDIAIENESNCSAIPTEYTGWSVATCNTDAAVDDPVGVIYDVRQTTSATPGTDWAPTIDEIHPANWTLGAIGQIFGIAIGHNDIVYLAASDVYDTQYDIDPYGPGQIFAAPADNDFLAEPFVELANTGGPLNGIGNIVYDRIHHQLFATNLEDGKIYRISSSGVVIETYDPWLSDDGSAGIVSQSEQVWGIGLNVEAGEHKLYFPRISNTERSIYSIELSNGAFPAAGSESIAIANVAGVGDRVTDIAFSDDGSRMIFTERGTRFTEGAHDATTQRYTLSGGNWNYDLQYYIGAWVTQQFPNIMVETGQNSAGGVDFGATTTDADGIDGCDQLVWNTMNYFRTPDGSLYYGMQGIDVDGNNTNGAEIDPNHETDIIIDFDGAYDNFEQKGNIGDVEIFRNGGALIGNETGVATATTAGSCGEAVITYKDSLLTEGPCDGSLTLQRIWTATDSQNTELSATCIQLISLVDDTDPTLSNVPANITVAPTANCNATVTWAEPTADDNCGIATVISNYASGAVFAEGQTTVTYTATDSCGRTATASFVVTVTDCCAHAPVITCPAAWTACVGTTTSPATTGTATAIAGTSTCSDPEVTYTDHIVSTGPCAGAKHIERTWIATDPENPLLTASCVQVIILTDTQGPQVYDCPSDITVTTSGTSAVVTWQEPTATDDCGLEWIMADYQPGDTFPIGSTTVTYTAVDDCENVTPCTFVVTVEQVGSLTCPDDIVVPCTGTDGTVVTWDLPVLETACPDCTTGDSIPGFIYMGALGGSKYYCSMAPAASASATAIAASYGGHLASITSAAENDLLAGMMSTQCALIGYTDVNTEGHFVWSTGETSTYSNWSAGQPNSANGNQDCTVLCSDGWNDSHCEVAYEYIMELPCTTYEQTSGPANGSAIDVGTHVISYTVTDQCGYSLSCSFTVTVESAASLECPADHTFTCPAGQQGVIAHWDTPALHTCCPDCGVDTDTIAGFMYMGSYGGSKYFCSLYNAGWQQAQAHATAVGGQLAEVNSAGENAFLANILTLQRAWIGLSDSAQEGTFSWASGAPVDYTNWYPGQPNDQSGYQDYVAMLNNGQWNDEYNNVAMEYIVEVTCTSVTQIAGPPSGSVIPPGTTTITYAGEDACGNTDTCSFDIMILTAGTCPSYSNESWYMWIDHIGLGNHSNTSGNDGGYGDFTEETCIEVVQGQSYPLTLTPGFANNLYNVYWKIWIDYNQDGDYYDAGEYAAYGSGYQQLSGHLPIAAQCLTGQTTMRVSMKYGSYPTGPCEVFAHGEVEDYCLDIWAGGSLTSGGDNTEGMSAVHLYGATGHSSLLSADLDYDIAQQALSIETPAADHELHVYPNPATTTVTLELSGADSIPFRLYDQQGKIVMDKTLIFTNGLHQYDVNMLTNGVYYLKSVDGRHSKKLIVLK